MRRFLIVSNYIDSYEVKRLLTEADSLGYEPILVPMYATVVHLDPETKDKVTVRINLEILKQKAKQYEWSAKYLISSKTLNELLPEVKGVVFRGLASKKVLRNRDLRYFFIYLFERYKIFVLNKDFFKSRAINKLHQHVKFLEAGIPFVPSTFVGAEESLKIVEEFHNYPVYLKPASGSHGKRNSVATNLEELRELFLSFDEPAYTFIQDKLDTNWDIRVLLLGGKPLGAMKRIASEGAIVTNFSAGGSTEKYTLSSEEAELSIKIAKALGADYGGLDIMYDSKGNRYILEFNVNAQFKGFENATGMNVAKEMVRFVMER